MLLEVNMFKILGEKFNALMVEEGISGIQLVRKIGLPASTVKRSVVRKLLIHP